jgi:hypothetical protein
MAMVSDVYWDLYQFTEESQLTVAVHHQLVKIRLHGPKARNSIVPTRDVETGSPRRLKWGQYRCYSFEISFSRAPQLINGEPFSFCMRPSIIHHKATSLLLQVFVDYLHATALSM